MDKEPNRTANGIRQTYEYDGRGQLLVVKEGDADVERYAYDKAGNMLKKTIRGKTTTFAFDGANQLVSSTTDGVTTKYAYDAAGRLVREGEDWWNSWNVIWSPDDVNKYAKVIIQYQATVTIVLE